MIFMFSCRIVSSRCSASTPRSSSASAASELVARYGAYEGPIFAASDREPGPLPILADEFVTTEDGTGIVHLAPAFGEDDYRVAAAAGIFDADDPRTLYNPVKPDGTYDERARSRDGAPLRGALRQGRRR